MPKESIGLKRRSRVHVYEDCPRKDHRGVMTNPTDWLLWNLSGRPRIPIPKELFTKVLIEEGFRVIDSVPAYKYSEYMAEVNRRAWQLLEQRAFTPASAARQKAVIAAGKRRLKKQRALVADLHMKVLADRGYEIDQLDRTIETKLKLIEMMSSQIAELKTERDALLVEQKRVQQNAQPRSQTAQRSSRR